MADAENTRRRAERSLDEMRQYATANFAREMLGVADNLRRAIDAVEPNPVEDAALLEGVRSTERMLTHALELFGVRKIEALGAPFDPALHEAVMEVDDSGARARDGRGGDGRRLHHLRPVCCGPHASLS